MELELGAVSLLASCSSTALAMVRERASRHGITLTLDVSRRHRRRRRPTSSSSSRSSLNLLTQRRQVHADGGARRVTARREDGEAHVSVRDTGIGIPEAERERIFEAFQRGGRGARDEHRGHRARPHAVAADRRAARRPPVDGERARARQHLLVRDPGAPVAGPRRRPRARRASRSPTRRRRRARRRGRPRAPPTCCASTSRAPATPSRSPRDGVEGLELARRLAARGGASSTSCCRGSTAGTCSRGSRRTPRPPAIPVVIVSMLDERGNGVRARRRRVPRQAGRARRAARRAAPLRARRPTRRTVVVIDDDPVDLDLVEAALGPEG